MRLFGGQLRNDKSCEIPIQCEWPDPPYPSDSAFEVVPFEGDKKQSQQSTNPSEAIEELSPLVEIEHLERSKREKARDATCNPGLGQLP